MSEWEEVRTNAIRQFQHNDCSGLVFAYGMEIINDFVDKQDKEISRLKEALKHIADDDCMNFYEWQGIAHRALKEELE